MIAFIKEHGAYMQKDLSEIQLVDWFKDNSMADGAVVEDIILYGSFDIKADEEGFPWVLSDFTLDRDMERMDPSGWDLKEFRKNPIVLFGHDSWIPAIGVMKNVKKPSDEKGALTGTVMFDESGSDPFAVMIANKVRSGILTKGSVGFRTKKIEILEGARDGTRLIHREQELMEFSIVNIPANPNAQVQRSMTSGYMRIVGDEPGEGWADTPTTQTATTDPKSSPEKIVAHGVTIPRSMAADLKENYSMSVDEAAEALRRASALPKNYVELLMQDNGGSETSSPGETSRIESLFTHSPAVSGENQTLQELFNEN